MPQMSASAKTKRAASGDVTIRERAIARFEAGFALAEVTRLMRSAFDARMRTLGLTGSTWRVISYLARDDGITQAELARRLEISRVAAGEAIDRLEKSGHVMRQADAQDRRIWRVHLTPKARTLLPSMFEAAGALQESIFCDFSAPDLQHLQTLLGRLRARLLLARPEVDEVAAK